MEYCPEFDPNRDVQKSRACVIEILVIKFVQYNRAVALPKQNQRNKKGQYPQTAGPHAPLPKLIGIHIFHHLPSRPLKVRKNVKTEELKNLTLFFRSLVLKFLSLIIGVQI